MEAITIRLKSAVALDGVTPINKTREDAVITQQRLYEFSIAGPAGLVGADIFGLFSPVGMKLVGVAASTWNMENKVRVISPDPLSAFRQEITLKPDIQFVAMYPGDKLALYTEDERLEITLVVNDMSEGDAALWGLAHEPYAMPARFRIVRGTGVLFAPNTATIWQPAFHYDPATGLMIAQEDGTGMIPSSSLCLYPRWQGCYVTIRYAGSSGTGRFHIVDNTTRKSWIAESGITDVRWSKVQYIGADDGIALEAAPAVPGQPMVCDIELSRVLPSNRLVGRYERGL